MCVNCVLFRVLGFMPTVNDPQWARALFSRLWQKCRGARFKGTALSIALAIPTVIFVANKINLHQLEVQGKHDAHTIVQGVSERIGVINTVLASLVGLHDVTTDLDNDKLVRFSKDILKNAAYIRNLGSYKRLPHEQRVPFEADMQDKGYADFSISHFEESGQFSVRADKQIYYPAFVAGPARLTLPEFSGTDLGALPGFSEALETIGANNTITIMQLPGLWPMRGDLIAFEPVYEIDPISDKTISKVNTGGFWLTLDIEHLFDGLSEEIRQFDASVELIEADKHTLIHSIQKKDKQTLFLTGFYSQPSIQETWQISPSTKLVITLKQSVGLTAGTLAFICISLILIILLSCLNVSRELKRRATEIEREAGLQALIKEREKAEKTLNSMQDAIITLDPAFNVVHINPAAAVQFNTRSSFVVGKPFSSFAQFQIARDNGQVLNFETLLANLAHNDKREIDVIPAGHGDEDFVFRMSLSSSRDHEERATGHVIVLRDISHEKKLSRKLAYQANYDALTGCTNRYYFENSLERLIGEMPATGLMHTLCYMDLDQFKIVNDTCGHRAGDQLLIELTNSLKHLIRKQDILSRLGGDEFGLILVGLNEEEASVVSARVYEFFQKFIFAHNGNSFSITASIGIVHINSQCATSKDIMAAADIACYAAKDSGRNTISVYSKTDEGMAERSEELNWLPRLQKALQNDEFRLHAQAVASLHPHKSEYPITHFEFLLRLANPDGTEVTPWQFIQAAERYDLMREIDRWVICNALKTVAQYADGAGSGCSYSINLSGQSAADPSLKLFIQDQITLHQVDPSTIWFELTETAAISHFSIAVDLIKNIRSTGAKVALDDFGSGLSSFGYLKNLPVDVIKIDGQFVKEIVNNPIDREMVRAIHRVGESMNIETVAEFVENQAIVDELVRIGVNYAQGYHIGKPLPVAQALAALVNSSKAA